MIAGLRKREGQCPDISNFYVCNGFRGCCMIDPCGPGGACPFDKDLSRYLSLDRMLDAFTSSTPFRSTVTVTTSMFTTTTLPTSSAFSTSSESSTPSVPSVPSESSTLSGSSTLSSIPADQNLTSGPAEPTTFETTTHSISESPAPTTGVSQPPNNHIEVPQPPSNNVHSTPVAAIVGAVLGTVILLAAAICIFLCVRKRHRAKLTKTYKAPMYPSPDVGNDMSAHLDSRSQFQNKVAALSRAESRTSQDDPQQLDSREIGRRQHNLSHISVTRLAELPAEPLPWPGSANT